MDMWVVWFYIEPVTLHLNRDRGTLSPIVLVPVLVPDPVLDTASVIIPSEAIVSQGHSRFCMCSVSHLYLFDTPIKMGPVTQKVAVQEIQIK